MTSFSASLSFPSASSAGVDRALADLQVAAERLFADAPVYAHLARRLAEEPVMVRLAAQVLADEPPTLTLLGVLQHHILGGTEPALGALYARLWAGEAVDSDALFAGLRGLCLRAEAALAPVVARARVQTNEVGRAAYLRLGLEAGAERFGPAPAFLVEVGASAGLNLGVDSFHFDCWRDGQVRARRGPAEAVVRLDVQLTGEQTPGERGVEPPPLTGRVGLELNPLDRRDPEALRWLLAWQWPEHHLRRQRLLAALSGAPHHPVWRADAVEALPAAVALAPAGQRVVVAHTFVVQLFPAALQEALAARLLALSVDRELWELSAEWAGAGAALRLRRLVNGQITDDLHLGSGDVHGGAICWAAG